MNALIGTFRQARRERDAQRGRLGAGVYKRLVDDLADTILLAYQAGATASLWGMEGPLRHGIRADLCLQGWRWNEADTMAAEVLAEAFRVAGAVRPAWEEGQRDWTNENQMMTERTRCIRCHGPLPEGHHKFCGSLCGDAYRHHINRLKDANEEVAHQMAVRTI